MSLRYVGSWLQDGAFNPLTAPTPTTLYNLYGWGRNQAGQLGLNNRTYYSSPKQVGILTNWAIISASNNEFTCAAVKTDGSLWTWGKNAQGQLGLGNTTSYSSPKQVGSLTNWLNVSAGYRFCLAIKTDGTLWSWGYNGNGNLGNGASGTNISSPIQVGALTSWATANANYRSSFAIKTNGTLWSWGQNSNGQLGLGNTTLYSSPKQVGALTNWLTVIGNYNAALALKTDGTLWSWGLNTSGQLGLGNATQYNSPKQIGALTNWSKISSSCNSNTSCRAVKTDGTLWSWGQNSNGQLGLGNTTLYSSPKQVGALTTWLLVTSGTYHALSIKTDGTLWSWGQNNNGELGLNNTTNYSSPKQVGALTSWLQVSGGYGFSMALG